MEIATVGYMEFASEIIPKGKFMSNQNYPIAHWPPYVDPANGQKLILHCSEGQDYMEIAGGGRKYPVVKGIPRLLENPDNYAAAFGEQWLRWRTTQLDSFTGTTISRDRIYRCLGSDGLELLKNGNKPIQILEVGCGAGRFTEILLQFPAVRLTSMDLSQAVEANALNFPPDANHRIVQADIMMPPFPSRQFDIVICLGVIQHTPSPEDTIRKLYDQVKPGGYLVIDHYTFEIRRLTKITGNLLRPIIKRLPSRLRMRVVERMVDIFFPVHRAIRNIPLAQKVFSRISPIITYFHAYPQLPDQLQREWAVLDTHDGMTDWFKHLRSINQIREILQALGAVNINVSRSGHGVEATCSRPKNYEH